MTLGPVREVTQSILYTPEAEARGVRGNCLQASMASALDLDLDAVPHFAAFASWSEAARLWLHGRGLDWHGVYGIPVGRSIIVGPGPRGREHAVVGEDGEIVWDPHPSRTGLLEIRRSYLLVPLA